MSVFPVSDQPPMLKRRFETRLGLELQYMAFAEAHRRWGFPRRSDFLLSFIGLMISANEIELT